MAEQGESIKKDIQKRKVDNLQSGGNFINLEALGALGSAGTIAEDDDTTITVTLSNDYGLPVFAILEYSVYAASSADAAYRIPDGTSLDPQYWNVTAWYDKDSSDGNNLVLKIHIYRGADGLGGTFPLYYSVRAKNILNSIS